MKDNRSFYFPLERRIWKRRFYASELGTEKVWMPNPRIVIEIRPNLNKLSLLFSVCFSLEAVETIWFERLHTVFLTSFSFVHGVGT